MYQINISYTIDSKLYTIMGSYCPICDQFVDSLDHCELPYDGNPPPSYDDSICSYEISGDDGSVRYNFEGVSGKVFINVDNKLLEVDDENESQHLFRQNAMTYYEYIYNWLIVVRDFNNDDKLFYLVKCKNYFDNWLQVNLNVGDTILDIY